MVINAFVLSLVALVMSTTATIGFENSKTIGIPRVIDGDTLEVTSQRIRLFGIDAPESRQTCHREGVTWLCSQEAELYLRSVIENKSVDCEKEDIDRYGRIVATCFNSAGEDIAELMVRNGWALAYRQYSKRYVELENEAARMQVGLWAGQFVRPWNWRKGERLVLDSPDFELKDENCLIKGNISSRGERIYHSPESKYYEATRIDETKGEAWFCSEEDALAAGFRRAK